MTNPDPPSDDPYIWHVHPSLYAPYPSLRQEYVNLLAHMKITRLSAVQNQAKKLLANVQQGKYAEVATKLGIPQLFIATSFEREASSNFALSPAQGDPWNEVSTHVPRGLGPFANWTAAAIKSYTMIGLDKIGIANWTWPMLCYQCERFNGFGYRQFGINTPYDWAGTNEYTNGKYTSDGSFSRTAVDVQLGTIPVARTMAIAHPELNLPLWPGVSLGLPSPIPMQVPLSLAPPGKNLSVWEQLGLQDN